MIRKPYAKHERVFKTFEGHSRTKQAFKDECDINNIMRRYEKTGLIAHRNEHEGLYGDFIGYQDYQTSMNQVLAAQDMFDSIPARIRARFQNSAAEFLRFVQDPANADELVQLGLAEARPSEAPPEPQEEPASPPAAE